MKPVQSVAWCFRNIARHLGRACQHFEWDCLASEVASHNTPCCGPFCMALWLDCLANVVVKCTLLVKGLVFWARPACVLQP